MHSPVQALQGNELGTGRRAPSAEPVWPETTSDASGLRFLEPRRLAHDRRRCPGVISAVRRMSARGPTLSSRRSIGHGSYLGISCRHWGPRVTAEDGPGCVKTLRGITAPRILRLMVTLRAKNAKIRPSLGVVSKSDFVFTQSRPAEDIHERRPQAAFVQVGRATSSRPTLSLPQ
jgi:hypothetical protein